MSSIKNSFTIEERIIHHILVSINSINNIGLFEGKLGIVIFLHHYSRAKENKLYADFANELLDEIWDEINTNITPCFDKGLLGIGWGIEYLIQNNFVEGNSYDICEVIDQKIMERDPLRIIDNSLETGLAGLLHYILFHIKGCLLQNSSLPFDSVYLHDLYNVINISPNENLYSLINSYNLFFKKNKTTISYNYNIRMIIQKTLKDDNFDEEKLINYPSGLRDGLSGFLLNKYIL